MEQHDRLRSWTTTPILAAAAALISPDSVHAMPVMESGYQVTVCAELSGPAQLAFVADQLRSASPSTR